MSRKRTTYSAEFKAKRVIEVFDEYDFDGCFTEEIIKN